MRKSTALGLTALVLGSIAVRLSPLWSFLYWGSDTGEYFAILRGLVRTGHVSTMYDGWGVTYPYFPGMFFLQGGLAHLSGLDLPTVLNLLVPILGALSVVPIFLIARRVTGEDRVALFAAALLVGAIPHAYTTAHPAPATVGNLLALTGLLLFLRLRTDRGAMVPLVLVSGTLIATHHLSLYFYLLMVLGTIIVQGLARPWRWTAGSKREVAYASLLLAGTFVYWLVYATTFREFILTDVDIRPWWAVLVLFGLGLVFLGAIIYARTRIGWRYRPRYPGLRYRGTAYTSAVGVILILGIVSVVFGGPRTTFPVPAVGLVFVANAFAGVPPPSTLAGWREGTIPAALDPAYWARDHASGLVVSDHHGSTTVFGFGGLNATWDRSRTPFLLNLSDPRDGLGAIDSPSGIKDATYVWIDRDMKAGVRLRPFEPAVPMPADVAAKFDGSSFIKVFDNGYAQVYWIVWGCATAC